MSGQADKTKADAGIILHTDKSHVYQQVGKSFVTHHPADFKKVPTVGQAKSISYDGQGKAVVVDAESVKLSLGVPRNFSR
ncbi:MAG: hypothetical protein PHR16_14640 [Methylovulum sp.]|nr:hypothetical protein [Methylovulum sp.]